MEVVFLKNRNSFFQKIEKFRLLSPRGRIVPGRLSCLLSFARRFCGSSRNHCCWHFLHQVKPKSLPFSATLCKTQFSGSLFAHLQWRLCCAKSVSPSRHCSLHGHTFQNFCQSAGLPSLVLQLGVCVQRGVGSIVEGAGISRNRTSSQRSVFWFVRTDKRSLSSAGRLKGHDELVDALQLYHSFDDE